MSEDKIGHTTTFVIEKKKVGESEPYQVDSWEGNVGLDEGLAEMWDLVCGLGSPTAFDEANAHVGVGDSDAGASSSQEGLQGTNKEYKGMDAGYPTRTGTEVEFKSTFGPDDALFTWKEFTVANGDSDSAKNMLRKVHVRDEKYQDEEWTMRIIVSLE